MISLRNVSLIYPNGVHALDNVNLEIAKGEFVFLVGHSGTGKSSLLRLLYREARPTAGEIILDGIRVDRLRRPRVPALRRHLGVVFQDFKLLIDKTVWENVAFAMQVTGAHTRDIMRQVPRVLDLVGLSHKSRMYPGELSGGEQQRSAIARALVNNPKILLCDEPTGNLDPSNTSEIMELLLRINLKGTTVVVATHNQAVVDRMRRRVVRLEDGRIVTDEERGYYYLGLGQGQFFLGEVLRNFTRNASMQATAIGTVAITIVLLGLFLFVRAALAGMGAHLLDQIEISAYLKADAGPAQVRSIRHFLTSDPRVASADFIPKKQGLAELRDRTKGVIDTALLTENPLPDKFRVKVHIPDDVPAVAAGVRRLDGIENVVYGQTIVQRLLQLGVVLRRIGIGVIVVFLAVAGIIISNTIRLTVFARRREISIMQLVGATNLYIRIPFICEGLLDGLVGASLAIGILAIARATLWPRLLEALPWIQLNVTAISPVVLIGELFAVGGAVGIVASWISVGRHLRT